jgi:hypothetical protein
MQRRNPSPTSTARVLLVDALESAPQNQHGGCRQGSRRQRGHRRSRPQRSRRRRSQTHGEWSCGFRRRRRGSLYSLGRLPKCAEKRLTHAFPVAESGLTGNDFDRMPCRLHHQPGRLDTQTLNGLGGRLAGFLTKHPAELTWTQPRDSGQGINREVAAKILRCIGKRHLHAVGLCIQLQQRRELRLPAATPLMQHKLRVNIPKEKRP